MGRVKSVCGGRDSGRLLTAVSLIQAIGAVLDPITGRDTQSIHRAEELSRAGWRPTGSHGSRRVPLRHMA